MKLPVMTIVTSTVLAFTILQTTTVLAQETEIGAASRPFPLYGGPSQDSENRGQTVGERPDATKRSGEASSEKRETRVGKIGETTFRGRSQSHIGLSVHPRHRVAAHRRGRRSFAFRHRGHRFVTHRRGHRFAALNEPGGV